MVGLVRRLLNRTRDAKVELAHPVLLHVLGVTLCLLRRHHLVVDQSGEGWHALRLKENGALLLDLCDQVHVRCLLVSIRN